MNGRATLQPWQEIRRMQREVERMFSGLAPAWRWPLTGEYPPINLTRTEQGLAVSALCPGVERDSIDVTVVENALTLRCERKPQADASNVYFHRRERPVGTFSRTINLGEHFDPDRTEAVYKNGILNVQLARGSEPAPKRIEIKS
jgi:HSP20 family protein